MTVDHDRLSELFERARMLSSSDRTAWLGRLDPALRSRLEVLLDSDERPDGFLETPALLAAEGQNLPDRIGPYRVLGLIGRGGMGVVYRAQQPSPRRDVALKIINPGLLGREAMRRLRREAELLARLRHPGIAQIYEAGTATIAGIEQPFFAMELVKGERLTSFAEEHGLSSMERLELLAEVCDAVHHAHTKGVIHRDLKPGNVLVEHDSSDRGRRPRVLDFGIALATERDVEATLAGAPSGIEGTLAYMSPEQLRNDADIDTRADVYALGVLGFELLAGELPFQGPADSVAALVEHIERVEPRRLSTVRSGLGSDLDTVFACALAKDRDRRYSSAAALASDVRAFLDDRPIAARPPSALYQLRKLARRNKSASLGVLVALAALLAGLGLMAFGLVRADQAAALARERAEEKAEEAAFARATANFYHSVLLSVDPALQGVNASLLDLLENTEDRAGLIDQPRLEADVREAIGFLYRRHGRLREAELNLRRSLEVRQVMLGDDHPDVAVSKHVRAQVLREYRGAYVEALALVDQAIEVLEPLDHEGLQWAHLDRAAILLRLGRLDEAAREAQRSLRIVETRHGPEAPWINVPLRYVAEIELRRGRPEIAREACERGLAVSPPGVDQEYPRALLELRLARLHLAAGELQLGSEVIDRVLEGLGALVAPNHPAVGEAHEIRCRIRLAEGDAEGALRAADACASIRGRVLHAEHWLQDEARVLRAMALLVAGRIEEARTLLEASHMELGRRLGGGHPVVIDARRTLLEVYTRLDEPAHATSIRSLLLQANVATPE